jgi:DNA-binding transcriptional LysR family regulator
VFTAALRVFSAERPDVDVKVHLICWNDQVEVLHDGRADIAFLHLPVDESGLGLVPVRAEPRVAALPADHRAATGRAVAIAELADDPVILQGGASDAWQAFHNVDPRPDGRHPRPGPAADNLEEKLLHVAAGRGISFLPASSAAVYAQRDVAYVPVADIPPIQVCLGWSASRFSPAIKSFIEAVKRTARREVRQPAWPRRKPTRSSSSEEPTTSRPR